MGWKEEKRLTRRIMIGLASTMLGFRPLNIAGVDTGIAAAEEAAPDVRLPEKPSVAYVDEGGSVKVNALHDLIHNSSRYSDRIPVFRDLAHDLALYPICSVGDEFNAFISIELFGSYKQAHISDLL